MDNLEIFTMRVVLGNRNALVDYIKDKAAEMGLRGLSVELAPNLAMPLAGVRNIVAIVGDRLETTALASAVTLDVLEVIKSVEGGQQLMNEGRGWSNHLSWQHWPPRTITLTLPTMVGELDEDGWPLGGMWGPRGTTGSPGDKGSSSFMAMADEFFHPIGVTVGGGGGGSPWVEVALNRPPW